MPNEAVSSPNRDDSDPSEIFNGARCESYCWSQGHGDLEIRVKLPARGILARYETEVRLREKDIVVGIAVHGDPSAYYPICGRFEHEINTESAYWMIDKDSSCLVIYLDKREEMWWTKLLVHEQPTEVGPLNYTVSMDNLGESDRMAVDRLITDQRRKLTRARECDDDNQLQTVQSSNNRLSSSSSCSRYESSSIN